MHVKGDYGNMCMYTNTHSHIRTQIHTYYTKGIRSISMLWVLNCVYSVLNGNNFSKVYSDKHIQGISRWTHTLKLL